MIQFSQIWLILANKCLANSKSPKSIFFSRCIHFSFSTVSWLFFSFSILLLKEMQTTDNVSRVKCLNFSGKVLKFVHAQLYFFAVWFLTFFQVQLISFVKRKVNSTIEQRKLEGHEKLDRLLVSNGLNFFRFLREINFLPYDPVFSSWVVFIGKVSIVNYSRNSKTFKAIYFYLVSQLFSYYPRITLKLPSLNVCANL